MSHQFDRLFPTVGAAIAAHRSALDEAAETNDIAAGLAHLVALQLLDPEGRSAYRASATKLSRRWAKAERQTSASPSMSRPPLDRAFVSALVCDFKHALPAAGQRAGDGAGDFRALAVLAAAGQRDSLRESEVQATGRALLRIGFVHAAAIALFRLLSDPHWTEGAELELSDLMAELPPDAAKMALLNGAGKTSRLPRSLELHRTVTATYLEKSNGLAEPVPPGGNGSEAVAQHLAFRRARLSGDEEAECRVMAGILDGFTRSAKPSVPIRAFVLPEIIERSRALQRRDLERRALELSLIGRRGADAEGLTRLRPALARMRGLSTPAVLSSEARSPALVLVSQIQRSGGSLLSQLFDGHPDLFALPHELRLNEPKWEWPQINLREDPLTIFGRLFNDRYPLFIARGYSKADGNQAAEKDKRSFPLDLPQFVEGFASRLEQSAPSSRRDVLDAYFASFAASWGGSQDRTVPPRVTAFAPRLNMSARTCRLYFDDYPDGHFVTIVRDPLGWFASARLHEPEYRDVHAAIDLWKLSTYASLELAQTRPRHATVILYSDLIRNLDSTIALLCRRIGLEDHPALRMPTFLGQPILSNSSYQASEYGVRTEGLSRWRGELTPFENDYVTAEAMPLYDQVAALHAVSRNPPER